MTRELLTGADFKGPLQLDGAAGTSGQVLTSAGAGAVPTWSAAGGFSGGTLTSNLTLATGTSSLSPLTFQSGSLLTSETAGAAEFDGKVLYTTPVSRGVSPSVMLYRLESNYVGSNSNTAQPVFGVGVTLQSSTVYAFEYRCAVTKSTGGTSHSLSILFGGTATVNSILYTGTTTDRTVALPLISTVPNAIAKTDTGTISIGGTGSTAIRSQLWFVSGTVSINEGGTFIPQYTLSNPPGGAYSTVAGSYFAIWPISASGANTSVGPWA
jgi:hypothetical protein